MSWVKRLYFNLLYFRNPPWDTQVSPPELMEYIENNPPGRALDLGCGTGTNVITLAQHGWQVVGVDFVGRAIRHAERKSKQAGVKVDFIVNSVSRLDGVSGSFDLVLDIGCFHSLDAGEKDRYIANLESFTNPGSTLLMYAFINEPGVNGPGISESDLTNFESLFALSSREDGYERGERPSAWLTFKRKADVGMD
jgi:2-polyprenyl-3-methyl-5-hydroxy-6-metoxy-1,4-benzoquinol methylase